MRGLIYDRIHKNENNMKSKQTLIGLAALSITIVAGLAGCSNPDGEGLSDQQKLEGASKAREQQMSGQKSGQEGGGQPMTRDSLPGQNAPQ
jgi:hypothetical protein